MPKRDDGDGRDDVFGSGVGIKKTVTIVTTDTGQCLGGVQGALFKGRPCWGAARRQRGKAPYHPVGRKCAFDGSAVKSAFALLLAKVTKPPLRRRKEYQSNNRILGGDAYKTNNQRNVR